MSTAAQIRPSVFVGSLKEGRDVAKEIELHLHEDAEITVWSDGVFGLDVGYLESLVAALEKFDFAVLILTPDDTINSRDDVAQAPRDNIMFELGLFMGRLGRNRTFAVRSDAPGLKLPSDLAGVNLLAFNAARSDANKTAALSPVYTHKKMHSRVGRV